MKKGLVILGDQLFPAEFYAPYQGLPIFMAEDAELATHFKYHKQKIAFFFISMRDYADGLRAHGHQVDYHKFSTTSFLQGLEEFVQAHGLTHLTLCEVQDKFFEKALESFSERTGLTLEFLRSPMFLCSRADFKNYLAHHPKPFMKTFYEGERKRLGVLLEDSGGPVGGQWSYDVENRKKPPKQLTNLPLPVAVPSPHLEEVCKLVTEKFSSHPGELGTFWAPTTRESALVALDFFIEHHLVNFGDYQDALTNRDPFLYHAIISPMMNNGLLTPKEIVHKVLKRFKAGTVPLASVEGFVRQVMGWREFVRGVYQNFSEVQDTRNFFQHQRRLTHHWYDGTTGLMPVDDAIKKAQRFGYCHHIERLMVLSNAMLLCEVHPPEVHRWFMEMFIDSADWVMGPNVYGMGQFSDGGIFATKPYISGSNYLLKMSDYKKGEWCDIWDGLFWRFVGKNAEFLSKNYRMNMMVKAYEKMEPVKKERLITLADAFISRVTAN